MGIKAGSFVVVALAIGALGGPSGAVAQQRSTPVLTKQPPGNGTHSESARRPGRPLGILEQKHAPQYLCPRGTASVYHGRVEGLQRRGEPD